MTVQSISGFLHCQRREGAKFEEPIIAQCAPQDTLGPAIDCLWLCQVTYTWSKWTWQILPMRILLLVPRYNHVQSNEFTEHPWLERKRIVHINSRARNPLHCETDEFLHCPLRGWLLPIICHRTLPNRFRAIVISLLYFCMMDEATTFRSSVPFLTWQTLAAIELFQFFRPRSRQD